MDTISLALPRVHVYKRGLASVKVSVKIICDGLLAKVRGIKLPGQVSII